jgi:hypothetical protein
MVDRFLFAQSPGFSLRLAFALILALGADPVSDPIASAMTLLGKTDGASASDGTSYLDIAAFLRANGVEPKIDLIELWKRIVFNMAVSNTDDHLRNHGFILTSTGWRISPLFDVNPLPYGDRLSFNANEYDNRIDLSLAIEVADYFDSPKSGTKILCRNL